MLTELLPDWEAMFRPDRSLIETVLRGVITYFVIYGLLRLVLKRQSGSFGIGDMLLTVLIADAAQNAMIGQANSLPNGMTLVATLFAMNYLVDWACYRWPSVRELVESSPCLLVRDGRLLEENLRKERITEEELLGQIRLKGLGAYEEVFEARIESEGEISVLPSSSGRGGPPRPAIAGGEEGPASDPAGEGAPDFEAALEDFLRTARRLREAMAWHEARAEEHAGQVKRAKAALTQHGVQARAFLAGAGEATEEPGPS
jgi:uncharacterized membrane protein YcaP (DUF421 family)